MVSIGTIITVGIAGGIAAVGYGLYANREKIGRAVQRGVSGSITDPIGNYFENLFSGTGSNTGNQNMDTSITDQLTQTQRDIQTQLNNLHNSITIPDSDIEPYDQNAENQYNNDQEHNERMNMPPAPPEPEPTAPPYTPPTIPPAPVTPTPLAPVTPGSAAATGHTYYYLDYAGSVRDRIVSLLPGTAEIFRSRSEQTGLLSADNLGPINPSVATRERLRQLYS